MMTSGIKLYQCYYYDINNNFINLLINLLCVHAKLLQLGLTLCDPLDCVARQAPLSVGFSRQEYWNVLPCAPPEY